MSEVARMTKFDQPEKYVPPTRLYGNMKKFGAFKGKEVGDNVTFKISGKVTSMTMNEDMETIDVDISSVKEG